MTTHRTLLLLALAALAAAHAQAAPATAAMPAMGSSAPRTAAAVPMTEGEVLKVFPKAVLIKHGPIANMGMDAMTMQFGVANEKLLKPIRKGDKVRFAVDRVNGQIVVTRIERAK